MGKAQPVHKRKGKPAGATAAKPNPATKAKSIKHAKKPFKKDLKPPPGGGTKGTAEVGSGEGQATKGSTKKVGSKPFKKGGGKFVGGDDKGGANKKRSWSGTQGGKQEGQENGHLPINKKRKTKIERAKKKPGFDAVEQAKEIWNTFRLKNMEKEERDKLSQKLFETIKGKLFVLAVKHDAARVVQCALKHGNKEQRSAYFNELADHLVEFSKMQYAHFIVLRLVDLCSAPDERKKIIRAFKGKVMSLSVHSIASEVLDTIFRVIPQEEVRPLRMELYGKEFSLFASDDKDVTSLQGLIERRPDRKEQLLKALHDTIGRLITKGLYTLPFVQELIWEYLNSAGPKAIIDMTPTLTDHLLELTSSRPGCKVLADCIAYGSPKDRKKVIKALKGHVLQTLFHKDGYIILLRLLDVVDDTVTVQKGILQEMIKGASEIMDKTGAEDTLFQIATHCKASRILLNLLAPQKQTSFLPKDEIEMLKPVKAPVKKSEGPGDAGDAEEWVATSKKDPTIRRDELLIFLREPLVTMCQQHAATLLSSAEGGFVLYEVAIRWKTQELMETIAQAACGQVPGQEAEAGSSEGEGERLMREDRIAYKTIKRLLLQESEANKEDALFCNAFYSRVKGSLLQWLESPRGSFLIEALAKVPLFKESVLNEVGTEKDTLAVLSKTAKGADVLLKMLDSKE